MNKKDLIKAIQEKQEGKVLNLSEIETMVDALIQTITEELSQKEKVVFAGFGSFATAERKPKTGINPRTGKPIKIPAKTVPVFKAGKELKELVNK